MDFSVVIEAFKQYGLAATLLGVISIIMTGAVKLVFDKRFEVMTKEKRKAIYEGVSISWSALLALIYFVASKGTGFELYCQEALAVYAVAKVLYPLYENFRVRDLFQFIVSKIEQKSRNEEDKDGKL